jgi:hypothetical protein
LVAVILIVTAFLISPISGFITLGGFIFIEFIFNKNKINPDYNKEDK